MRIRLKYPDVDTFIRKYAPNINRNGMFIQSRVPPEVGTVLRFQLVLKDGEVLLHGKGRVVWIKEYDAANPTRAHGMGVRFLALDERSRKLIEKVMDLREPSEEPDAEQADETPSESQATRTVEEAPTELAEPPAEALAHQVAGSGASTQEQAFAPAVTPVMIPRQNAPDQPGEPAEQRPALLSGEFEALDTDEKTPPPVDPAVGEDGEADPIPDPEPPPAPAEAADAEAEADADADAEAEAGADADAAQSLWYGDPCKILTARYSCSASIRCTSWWAKVSLPRDHTWSARCRSSPSSPSAPPTTSPTPGPGSSSQRRIRAASCRLVCCSPRSSRATSTPRLGSAALSARRSRRGRCLTAKPWPQRLKYSSHSPRRCASLSLPTL